MGNLYYYTTLLSGVIALTLAALLAGLRIRVTDGLQKYNRARWCLVGAFAVFGVLSLVEIILGGTTGEEAGSLTGCLVIVIGSLMAMFFTMTVLSFIHPQFVHRKQVFLQLAVIVPCGLLLIILRLHVFRALFNICFAVMLVAYLLLMAFYTRLFVKSYREFKTQMLSFYEEEDLVGQLHWINWTFWLALSVGIMALFLLAGNRVVSCALTIVFTFCFLVNAISFVNFKSFAPLVDRAVTGKTGKKTLGVGDNPLIINGLKDRIDAWVDNKGYLDNTKSVEDIAAEIGWHYHGLKQYIKQTTGEDFRTWRIRLRVEEAIHIMTANPDIPVSHVATMAGFNDRSYFYRTFQKVTGKSVKAFQDSLKKG
ncbi:MAG: helix-turn-helix transcriptional regulator [Bacteroidales bacterium]|nr:helix-turn-helix transcriptional regulator [Bacteroidales bacterium]